MKKSNDLNENELSKIIVNSCYNIHVELGPGLLESVYEEILYIELIEKGLEVIKTKNITGLLERRKIRFGIQNRFNS